MVNTYIKVFPERQGFFMWSGIGAGHNNLIRGGQ
jgi:hypothetical protein